VAQKTPQLTQTQLTFMIACYNVSSRGWRNVIIQFL